MPAAPEKFDVIVLGAGAAGLMCASVAAQLGRRVLVLERNPQPGRKILISGGGRCNFTNLHCGPANFLSGNPHFAKSALSRFTPQHFLEMVNRHGIAWHEKTLGQLFCNHSSRAIVDMLLEECAAGRVDLRCDVRGSCVERSAGSFAVETPQGVFEAAALVVATGGLSIAKLGATGAAYDIARQFGLALCEPRPALVPLTLHGDEQSWTGLTGVAAEVIVRAARGPAFRERMLFTHRGISGPAILQASSYWRPGEALSIDLSPSTLSPLQSMLSTPSGRDTAALQSALREILPLRLAAHLAQAGPARWTNASLEEWERKLHRWEFHPDGTEGFDKAEVTAGGVDTNCLQSQTMEARNVSGLFFLGEAVDVTGHLGGFNFQWAWSSAVAAGRAL